MRETSPLECNDDELVREFIDHAFDLVWPFFDDEKELDLKLKLVAEAARGDTQLWKESGRMAFRALVEGFACRADHRGARPWAALVESLVKRLCSMAGIAVGDQQALGPLLKNPLKIVTSNQLTSENLWALLGEGRIKHSKELVTRQFACVAASRYRNKHAHNQWPETGWRLRLEIAESVLLTLLSVVEKYPLIERVIVFRQAWASTQEKVAAPRPTQDYSWQWRIGDEARETSSEELVQYRDLN